MILNLTLALIGLVTLLRQAVAWMYSLQRYAKNCINTTAKSARDKAGRLSDKRACFDQTIAEWMHEKTDLRTRPKASIGPLVMATVVEVLWWLDR